MQTENYASSAAVPLHPRLDTSVTATTLVLLVAALERLIEMLQPDLRGPAWWPCTQLLRSCPVGPTFLNKFLPASAQKNRF